MLGGLPGIFDIIRSASIDIEKAAKRTRTQVLKVCTKGHPLKMRRTPFARVSAETGELVPGTENLRCWGCKNPINIKRGYFRCSYVSCDYDVGMNCGLVADLEWADEEEDPIDDRPRDREDRSFFKPVQPVDAASKL